MLWKPNRIIECFVPDMTKTDMANCLTSARDGGKVVSPGDFMSMQRVQLGHARTAMHARAKILH